MLAIIKMAATAADQDGQRKLKGRVPRSDNLMEKLPFFRQQKGQFSGIGKSSFEPLISLIQKKIHNFSLLPIFSHFVTII
jgi:hypothetical protein